MRVAAKYDTRGVKLAAEPAALAFDAFDHELAAVPLQRVLDDRKAESRRNNFV